MIIDSIGEVVPFSDVQVGEGFFAPYGSETTLHILTADAQQQKAVVIFSREGEDRSPWVTTSSFPRYVLRLEGLIVRPSWASLTFSKGTEVGCITRVGADFYLHAAFRKQDVVSLDLQTGITIDVPNGPVAHFPNWEAGLRRDDGTWDCLFVWPPIRKPAPSVPKT